MILIIFKLMVFFKKIVFLSFRFYQFCIRYDAYAICNVPLPFNTLVLDVLGRYSLYILITFLFKLFIWKS